MARPINGLQSAFTIGSVHEYEYASMTPFHSSIQNKSYSQIPPSLSYSILLSVLRSRGFFRLPWIAVVGVVLVNARSPRM